ncbi:MAG: PilN domain-containing protein [Candidatus Aminicenantes bacterium]|nr:PilN domain-containing protein [Candidatus Aminicenantes bacterium]
MIRINLLKPERKEIRETTVAPTPEFKERRRQSIAGVVVLLALVAIVVLFFYQRDALTKENNLLRDVQAEKKSLQDVVVKLDELEKQRNLFKRKIRVITQLQSRQENAVIIMDELSKHLPNWVWLTELGFSAQEVRVKGRAVSNNLIADYIFNLEESPYFRNVNLISSTQRRVRNNQYLEFSLTAIFVGPSLTSPVSEEPTEGEKK